MKKSRIIAALLALTMIVGTAAAAGGIINIPVVSGMRLVINGQEVTPTNSAGEEIELFAYKDATYAPVRYIAELLGLEMDWNAADPTAAILKGNVPGLKAQPASYKPGTYTATAMGNNGDVTVAVTTSATAITKVEVTKHAETPSIGGPAIDRIPGAIVDNQSLAIDALTGATRTSEAILNAAAKAIEEAGGNVEALKNAAVNSGAAVIGDMSADVVVIGAGGSGMSAAIEAKDKGAGKVILVEKMAAIGGTTFTSQGLIGAYDSKLQKSMGVELTYDAMWKNLMNNASWHLDPVLTEITLKNSGATVDWLMDRVKVDINNVTVGYGPLQMMHTVNGQGAALAEPFSKALEETGVEVLLETRATELVMNADGSVGGVKVTKGGKESVISAKSVVIATGGYANNPELTALLTPELAGTWGIGHPASTGDGIIMASNVGAALTHTDDMMCVLKDYEIMAEHNGTSDLANNRSFMALPNVIMVGAEGKRFVNEKDAGYMSQKLNAPVFDQMHKDNLGYVWCISDQAAIDATNGKTYRNLGLAYVTANTPEELAAKMGVDPEGLAKTIADFNSYVDAGYDAEFRRNAKEMAKLTAPYVALAQVPCEIITYGGVARNAKSEVIRADGSSIPGLYVAGEASANSAYMGFTLTNCFTWGRIAGANAAGYAK